MESFRWTKDFETGLHEVDHQHRHLIDVINRFGNVLVQNQMGLEEIEGVFQELTSYTEYHFREEELLMKKSGIDRRHYVSHVAQHRNFIQEIMRMHAELSPDNRDTARQLLDFLCHWLVYHILGQDQNMARQIELMQVGVSPDEAYVAQKETVDRAMEPLLVALTGIFRIVSSRNEALQELNQSLELRVEERTRELIEANRRLEDMALTDVLTGLPNRRHGMRRLKDLWAESVIEQEPLSVMMIDADHFKEVNDTYGHDLGDKVLCELARTLNHSVRSDDIVCRLGGDEFLIICSETDQAGAMKIAVTAHQRVKELRVRTGDGEWVGSISVGVAARTPEMSEPEELLKRADEGVYAAKRDGKNCVRTPSK